MEELRKCLGIHDGGNGWTLVSDQQKGILNAVALSWPNAEHRNCAKHICANWDKTYKGEELKELYWKASRSYCEANYNQAMDDMKKINADAAEALLKENPKCYLRCFHNTQTKCDVIVNMAKTFNGYIVEARSKHIIYMLEDIRVLVMSRLPTKHSEMQSKDVIVRDNYDDVSMDLSNRTCTCRKWDLIGILCGHVCVVAGFSHKNVEEFVDVSYLKETYMRCYEFSIPPFPSERYWTVVDYPLDPPPIKAASGQPKKNRKRDPHEDPKNKGKLTKHGGMMTCGICGEVGNRKRSCKERCKVAEEPAPKRKKGEAKEDYQSINSAVNTTVNSAS
ncbi:uncharacterized protein LOC143551832 [Bidens hawaiensis]|uniref:uncharacterized protein LOC143551832 n=1 Tax=Bidens hawaiensis TaxID=980011 RepID=UPI00404B8805